MAIYALVDGLRFEQVGSEAVVTLLSGDIVVLNRTASVALGCISERPSAAADVSFRLAEQLGMEKAQADRFAGLALARLRAAHLIAPCAAGGPASAPPSMTRRTFSLGAAAAALGLAFPLPAFATEPSVGSDLGYWEDAGASEGSRLWHDPRGFDLPIPDTVSRLAPVGSLTHSIVEAVAPEMLVTAASWGLRASVSDGVAASASDLFDASGACVCDYALEEGDPDVILSIVPSESAIATNEMLSRNEEGVPVVHMVASASQLPDACRAVGEFSGRAERAGEVAAYLEGVAAQLERAAYSVPEESRKRVLVVMGEDALSSRGSSTVLDAAIRSAGAVNAAADLGEGVVRLESVESAAALHPDLVVVCPAGEGIDRSWPSACFLWAAWGEEGGVPVSAEPLAPYGWLDRSPLAIATVGALWLASGLYPDVCAFDRAEAAAGYWNFMYGLGLSVDDLSVDGDLFQALGTDSDDGAPEGSAADARAEVESPSVETVSAGSIARARARMSSGGGGGGGGGGGSSSGGSGSTVTPSNNSSFKLIVKAHFGFNESIASLLLAVVIASEKLCSSLSKDRKLKAAYIFFRTIGAFCYSDSGKQTFEWNAVAGDVSSIYSGAINGGESGSSDCSEEYFFTKTLGLTVSQYKEFRYEIRLQNKLCGTKSTVLDRNEGKFAEYKMSIWRPMA